MKVMKKFWFGFILLVMVAAVVGCGSQSTSSGTSQKNEKKGKQIEQTSLKIGLPLDTATLLPIYVADRKGFFKDEGLNVEVYSFKGDAGVVQALTGDSIDLTVASLTGLVEAIKSDQPFKAIWGGFNQSDFDWYSPNLKSIDKAKGAKFGITSYGSLTDFLTRYAVEKEGLDPNKDVKILQGGGSEARMAAMEAGQLDANILATPFKFMAADKGMHLLLSQKDLSPTWPQHVIYAKEDFIKNKPETIKAFLKGLVKADNFIKQNPDEAAKIMMDKLKFEEKYAKMSVKDITPGFDNKGGVDKAGLDFFWKITVESGGVDSPWKDEKWLDKTFIDSQDQWMK